MGEVIQCQGYSETLCRAQFPRRKIGLLQVYKDCIADFIQYEKDQQRKPGARNSRDDEDVKSQDTHRTTLSKITTDTRRTERELIEIIEQRKAAELYQSYQVQEKELLRCLEDTRKRKEVAGNLAKLKTRSQRADKIQLEAMDQRSMTGSERNEAIREWIDNIKAYVEKSSHKVVGIKDIKGVTNTYF